MKKFLNYVLFLSIIIALSGCSKNFYGKPKEIDYKINYLCSEGYELTSDMKCQKTISMEPNITYSCSEGYFLINGKCQKEITAKPQIKKIDCDVGYEYVAAENYCRSTIRTNAYYKYSCPNGYFEYDNYCWKYFGEDGSYVVDNVHIFCIKGVLTASGIINPSSKCKYYFRYEMTKQGPYCPPGYVYESSQITTINSCRSNNWKRANMILECPYGYYHKDQYTCSKILESNSIINYNCASGTQLNNGKCVNVLYEEPSIVYECPDDYTLDLNKQKCIK